MPSCSHFSDKILNIVSERMWSLREILVIPFDIFW